MRLAGTKLAANHQYRGFGDQLYDLSGQRPSLDLNFSSSKSLIDSASGQNLVTFTRASSGTYVGSDGLIKTATTNLLLQSEDFSTTWTTTDLTVSTNTTTAPTGAATADTLTILGASGAISPVQSATITESVVYTISIFINTAQTCDFIRLRVGIAGGSTSAWFTVSTKTWSNLGSGFSGGTFVDHGNNWIRASIQYTPAVGNGGSRSFGFGGTTTAGGTTADTGNTLIYWGAQLEQSTTVGEYVKTTSTINSAPRFDHNPTTGESLGLLVEESRTNLALQSEDFSTTWTSSAYAITTNATTAPNGTLTADKLIRDTQNITTSVSQNVTVIASTAYNYSCFVKASEWSKIGLREGGSTGNYVTFDLSTGTIISSSVATGAIAAYPNGWYRISMQMTTGGAQTTYGLRVVPLPPSYTSGTPSYSFAGDGTSGLFIWGAQLEAGSFPTSYIPTTTATVTRAADVASISGSNFSSWYRQDEGTVLVDVPGIYNTASAFTFSDGTNNNRILLDHGTNTRRSRIVTGGADQVSLTSSYVYGSPIKSTVAYALDNSALASNGSLSANSPDTSCVMPTVIDRLNIGSNAASATQAGTSIRRLTYWPQRLPNETLQAVTQ